MKNYCYVFILCCFNYNSFTQTFKLAEGPISNTNSDSRSVNFIDFNNDDWVDVYISNGLQGGQKDLLYMNDGTGKMLPVTDMDIVNVSNPSDGASFADYNNDGHIDGVISSWYGAEDLLYFNDGNGAFVYKNKSGITSGSFAETATFGDYDNDGWLDLYITNSGGNRKNFLYRNLGNGNFEQVFEHILITENKLSRGATWGDFNTDGFIDLLVLNEDNKTNDLFYGQGEGVYEKVNTGSLVASQRSSMTGSWGDIDNDGDFDLFVGNAGYFQTQKNQLFLNTGDEFEPVFIGPVVQTDNCTYGSSFADFDNDGDLDLFVANGFCNTNLSNGLYQNNGDGTFEDVSALLPTVAGLCSFGAAWGDVNNDGFLDVMVANCKNSSSGSQPANELLINQGNDNNWLKISLTGKLSNRSAVGAIIRVKAEIDGLETWQMREIRSQTGYAGQNSLIAHFGLQKSSLVDSLVISWPAGGTQILTDLNVNQELKIEESVVSGLDQNSIVKCVGLSVFPNPVSAGNYDISINIKSEVFYKDARLMLFDSLGQSLWNEKVQIQIGDHTHQWPTLSKEPASGIYQLVLEMGEERFIQKVVVQ